MGADTRRRWLARLTPRSGLTVEDLLGLSLGLDVWERQESSIVVAATEADLAELERRKLASIDRVSTVSDFVARRSTESGEEGETGGSSI